MILDRSVSGTEGVWLAVAAGPAEVRSDYAVDLAPTGHWLTGATDCQG